MKNDYKRTNFAEVVRNGEKEYYIRVDRTWTKVSKQVFRICKNSYYKIQSDNKRDYDKIYHFGIMDLAIPHVSSNVQLYNLTHEVYTKLCKEKLQTILNQLPEEYLFIIQKIYYEEKTASEVAVMLNTTQSNVQYKKRKILKYLKSILVKEDFLNIF